MRGFTVFIAHISRNCMNVVRMLLIKQNSILVSCGRNNCTIIISNKYLYLPGRNLSDRFRSGYLRAAAHSASLCLGETCSKTYKTSRDVVKYRLVVARAFKTLL